MDEIAKRCNVREFPVGDRTRMSFARIDESLPVPDLIEVQKNSYQRFLNEDLREVLHDVSPITDYSQSLILEFVDYSLNDPPKYDEDKCKERDATYARPLKVTVRLTNTETHEIKESEVFMGDFPIMTDHGTFIINGAERVVVSQLVRSPGVYYAKTIDKTGANLFSCTIIPNRGAWIEYETDSNGVLYVRIDRARKLPMTVLLRALGYETDAQLVDMLGEDERVSATIARDPTTEDHGRSRRDQALIEIYNKQRPGEPPSVESATNLLHSLFFDPKRYDLAKVGRYKYNKKLAVARRVAGRVAAEAVAHPYTGEILVEKGAVISQGLAERMQNAGVNEVVIEADEGLPVKVIGNRFAFFRPFMEEYDPELLAQYDEEQVSFHERVHIPTLLSVIRQVRDGNGSFMQLLKESASELVPKYILVDDIVASASYQVGLFHGIGNVDDIDHLGNRRLRSVGELLQNQIRVGMARLERVVKERMAIQDLDKVRPQDLINIRPVSAAIKEFFGSSQLSQFMDQPNPLAELTHKRRLSALGPGGLNRDRASFAVRDVHYSHYARICPIETPEGPNIGLIGSLATYARINEYGFIEAPYRYIDPDTHIVTDEIRYMTADEEDLYVIAQANEEIGEDGRFVRPRITVRYREEIIQVDADQVHYIDVSPRQLISVATGMIPFLENDDANRALMGSNMQRQAVPLLKTEAPLVGTGIEYKAACDSGVVTLCREDGVVTKVTANEVRIREDHSGEEAHYKISKFVRSNQGTCINQHPVVSEGDVLKKGDLIADGPSTDRGEIALGKNALIAFMTWEGFNYEDAVLLSERLVKEDVYTSIHIEEYEQEARDTKLGPEEITRDIPGVSDDALKDLDEHGIIRIGAEVRANDILVGKVTPKGETELTAEERLLRAIFGDKAREVRDTSLRVPHGEFGIVVDVKTFTRENRDELSPGVNQMVRVYIAQKRKISVGDKMAGRHGNKGVVSRILPVEDMPFLADGTPVDIVLNPLGVPSRMNIGQVLEVHLGLAAKALGWHVATPVFDGAREDDIANCLQEAMQVKDSPLFDEDGKPAIQFEKIGINTTGKLWVYDGRTGERFDNPVTVGYMYYLKLHHLVDDKIHARSTGPYSLVTQQPLGGKAQFGGQRFGEMEVWALEAYGASHVLQEILTVKSDDVVGRVKTYEAIVKGENIPDPGAPEAFKVLIKEMQSLALDIRVLDEDKNVIEIKELEDEPDERESKVNEELMAALEEDYGDDIDSDDDFSIDDLTVPGMEDEFAIGGDFDDDDTKTEDVDDDFEDDLDDLVNPMDEDQ
ncbi:MAG: DNA-directed RNA polymerase subunit beta [Christensenellales bacterium]